MGRKLRWLGSASLALGLLVMATALITGSGSAEPAGAEPGAPDVGLDPDGAWGPVETWPMVAIHAALTPEGDVLTYGTNADGSVTGAFIYDVWTPGPSAAAGHATRTNDSGRDFFCNLQLTQAETGDILLFGGDRWTGAGDAANDFIDAFDPATGDITSLPGMNRERWYGTGTTLPDGSFYLQGGTGGFDRPELWTAERGAELLPFFTFGIDIWYPRNFLLPDGRIFGFDVAGRMYTIAADLSRIDLVGHLSMPENGRGSTGIMFEPGKILEFGGDTTTAWIIDMTGPDPVVTATGSLSEERAWVNGVILPDGRVLAIGGADKDSQQNPDDPIASYGVHLTAEIWDPATGQWTMVAANAEERLYHATAILLPDGRVLSAGGGAPGPVTNPTAELYSPDYLLRADGTPTDRLAITAVAPASATAGDSVAVTVDRPADVDRVTLVKSGAVTHSVDMDQRFLDLPFSSTAEGIQASLPANPAVMPPGTYLLTVLDAEGVPSVSEPITVTSPLAPPPSPPPAPARVTLGDAVVDADGEGVDGVAIDLFASDPDGTRGVYLDTTVTDSQGNYGFAVDPGCYAVTVIAPAGSTFANGSAYLTHTGCYEAGDAETSFDATVLVDGQGVAAVGGTVTYADGTTAAGVSIDLFTSDEAGARLDFVRSTQSDGDGGYRFELPATGCYMTTMVAPGEARFLNGTPWLNNWACVEAGEAVTTLDGVLQSAAADASIGGTVTDGSNPAPGIAIDLFRATADGSRGPWLTWTTTDADGRYSFDGFTGCHVVTLIAPDGRSFTESGSPWLNETVCVSAGESATVDGALAPLSP